MGARLRQADLGGANLTRANLDGADLRDAYLGYTILTGADLSRTKNLLQEQLDLACGSEETKLPNGMRRPAHCEEWQPILEGEPRCPRS